MLARFRTRLTYANVMATLALFVALGGTGYASHLITSQDIKNRTIKGGDVRKNALGGTEINEGKLKTVPNARRAQTAAGADIAKNAETANQATTAGSANSAAVADLARDANTLAGQGAASFESSSVVSFGKAPVSPGAQSAEQAVLSWPEMGVEVRSSSGGCLGSELPIAFRNTKSSGPTVNVMGGPGGTVAPGTTERKCADPNEFEGELTDSTGRTLFVDCLSSGGELRCLGVRSEA